MLCNAVLVVGETNFVWREDAGSIATWGRVEQSLSVGKINDIPTMERIGDQFLELYSQPVQSHTIELTSLFARVRHGDTISFADFDAARIVEVAYTLGPDGNLEQIPSLDTTLVQVKHRKKIALDRAIQEVGGLSGASAAPIDTGSTITAGKLRTVKLASWSWSSYDDLDNQWDPTVELGDGGVWGTPYEVEEPCRLYQWVINARWKDDDDSQLTTGETTFQIYVNNTATVFFQSLPTTGVDKDVRTEQFIYGAARLNKGDIIRPVNLVNGAHEQGAVTIYATEPL